MLKRAALHILFEILLERRERATADPSRSPVRPRPDPLTEQQRAKELCRGPDGDWSPPSLLLSPAKAKDV
jgi:hypothetical protein